MRSDISFGWLSPVIGNRWSDHQPIVMYQERHILPRVNDTFDAIWIADHFYGFDERTDPFMEAWTTLTWLAAKFPDVKFCHHVLGHGYRHPALTAKMAATLQVLSGGRFILGIGAGWRESEYRSYGYPFPKPSVRFAQLDELVTICRLMWTEDHPTFAGEHFQIDDAAAPPLPEIVPPICIGASGEKVGLPLVGRQADMWNSFVKDDADWRRKYDIVRGAAEAAGRDADSIVISTTVERALPTNDAESTEALERLMHLRALGVTYFVMDFGHPQSTEPIDRFVEQVMAPLKNQG